MPRGPYPTGTVQVTLTGDGIPTYDIKENVAWDNIPLTDEMLENFRQDLLSSVRQDISLKAYKEKGFTFTYRYLSASTGEVFTEAIITPEDYR